MRVYVQRQGRSRFLAGHVSQEAVLLHCFQASQPVRLPRDEAPLSRPCLHRFLVVELVQPLPRRRGGGQVVTQHRGQPIVTTQIVEIVQAIATQGTQEDEGLHHLTLSQGLRRFLGRQAALRRCHHPTSPAQVNKEPHAGMWRYLLGQSPREVNVQRVR
jgi:hypothetical protein